MTKLPRVQPGDPVSADVFNALIDAANACGVTVGQSSGLAMISGPGGSTLTTAIPTFFWARTTGVVSGGTYPFTQQFPAASGGWTVGPLTGVAYETTGSTSVATGTYIKVWRTPQGDWRFTASQC